MKRRRSSLPDDHKRALLQGLRMIDEVIVTQGHKEGLDFEEDFLRIRPDFLIVTEDDKYGDVKRELCAAVGAEYTVLAKTPPRFAPVLSAWIARALKAPKLIAEMLNTLAWYGCAVSGPMVMRKSCVASWVGAIEWFIHS